MLEEVVSPSRVGRTVSVMTPVARLEVGSTSLVDDSTSIVTATPRLDEHKTSPLDSPYTISALNSPPLSPDKKTKIPLEEAAAAAAAVLAAKPKGTDAEPDGAPAIAEEKKVKKTYYSAE